mgnify:CR=1 FL=1
MTWSLKDDDSPAFHRRVWALARQIAPGQTRSYGDIAIALHEPGAARAVGLEPGQLKMGTDGCSAPNYAMPLAKLALGYARLAGADSEFAESFSQLSSAMTAHPELVSGTARSDVAFMRAGRGDWVTKVGADGVQAFASRQRGQAFAIKISDGNKPALFAATVAVLDQLGWLDMRQREDLRPWRAEAIANAKGTHVGDRKPVFTLARA